MPHSDDSGGAGSGSGATRALRRPECEEFGRLPDGTPVERWTFGDADHGPRASVLTFGGVLQSLYVRDRDGVPGNVVLGLPTLADYLADKAYLGAIVGRYANRIAHGRFTLDGTTYRLPLNDRGNTLHGGTDGFNRRVWAAEGFADDDRAGVHLRLRSADGDMGFPGTLEVRVTYSVDRAGTLAVSYRATTDRATVLNLTQHAYWNLTGGGSALDHGLSVAADAYLPVDAAGIPEGSPAAVAGTPFDLAGAPLRDAVGSGHPQTAAVAGGLDHCFVLPGGRVEAPRFAARLTDPQSGRTLETWTTEPGLQVYTANTLGEPFGAHAAVCLEAQNFPDAPNRPDAPSAVLRPGEVHASETWYRFGR
jgi:aldose 1-epimerase